MPCPLTIPNRRTMPQIGCWHLTFNKDISAPTHSCPSPEDFFSALHLPYKNNMKPFVTQNHKELASAMKNWIAEESIIAASVTPCVKNSLKCGHIKGSTLHCTVVVYQMDQSDCSIVMHNYTTPHFETCTVVVTYQIAG